MNRILHIVAGMDRGGLETFIMNMYRKLNREKFQFDFLVHTKKECAYNDEIKRLGGRIFYVPSRNKGIINNHKALDEFFRNHKEYRVVHQHLSSLSYIEPLKYARKYGVSTRVVHSHNTKQGGSPLHKYTHKFNKLFIKSIATHHFACSKLAAQWLYPQKQYKSNDFKLINNAIDTENFIFDEKTRALTRLDLGISNRFVLGHIGRFNHQKNHDLLIDIFKEVHDRNPSALLLLVGDGVLRSDIEEKVRKLGLSEDVLFTGIRADIPQLLQAMDTFVMPSYHEGLPVTLIEAQASDLPCVLSENITKEVEILNTVRWCSLTDDLSVWAENILSFEKDYVRGNKKKEIVDAGYDAENLVLELEKVYSYSL
ncbi:glycosyltransferase family 1 protein [Priestia megaterium]|uniref:glycosyltransferase family 1 protein n=1 Tax=Priestia megaterium TaxID=1404 RepID=UPI001482B571|nr:glycosyltransferase family 1 protein [Priestia megaterium]